MIFRRNLTLLISILWAVQIVAMFNFDFPLRNYAFYIPQGKLFVGAAIDGTAKENSIMSALRNDSKFVSLAPAKITINNKADQENPLFNASFNRMQMIGHRLLITKKDEPTLFILDDKLRQGNPELYAAYDLKDANGIKSPKILAIAGTNSNILQDPEQFNDETGAFIAVSNQLGEFKGNGSGIAVITLTPSKEKEDSPEKFMIKYYNSQVGGLGESRAAAIGVDTEQLKIGENLFSISDVIDMYYDNDLKCLYCALDTVASSDSNSGTRSLVVGIVKDGKLILSPIAVESAFGLNDSIVGSRAFGSRMQISKVTTLHTKTHLKYLILMAGSSISNTLDDKQRIYALPLVNDFASSAHGSLANVNVNPFDIFSPGPLFTFKGRTFIYEAKSTDDLYTTSSYQALVGGGAQLPGLINNIVAINDAVYVSVSIDGNSLKSGIFHSQAIFDQSGKIASWTKWKRAGGAALSPIGFEIDPYNAAVWTLRSTDTDQFNTILRSKWGNSEDLIEKIVKDEFQTNTGGVQGVFDFNYVTPSFTSLIGNRISLLALTGYNKLLLIQSGHDLDGNFGPESRDILNRKFSSNNGSLANFTSDVSAISISGGALSNIGAITASSFISGNTHGWLAVGGVGGLAILSNENGSGYNSVAGIGRDFSGFSSSMEFKLLGTFKNIRKLTSIANLLFILTDKELFKLEVSADIIAANDIKPVILAQVGQGTLKSVNNLSDMLILPPLGLLATSNGLFTTANLDNILVSDIANLSWNQFILPESAGSLFTGGPVTRLYAITGSELETDSSLGANIYVLNGAVSSSNSQIYRLFVSGTFVSLLPDLFIKNRPSFFVSIGDYRNFVATDGNILVTSRSSYANKFAFLEFLPPYLKSGQRFGSKNSIPLFMSQSRSIGLLTRNSATGNYSVIGDFGIKVNS